MKKTLMTVTMASLMIFTLSACNDNNAENVSTTTEVAVEEEAVNTPNFSYTAINEYMKSKKAQGVVVSEEEAMSNLDVAEEVNTPKTDVASNKGATSKPSGASANNTSNSSSGGSSGSTPSTRSSSTPSSTPASTPSSTSSSTPSTNTTCSHNWVEIKTTVHHEAQYDTQIVHHNDVWRHTETCTTCGAVGYDGQFPNCVCYPCYTSPGRELITPAYDENVQVLVKNAYDEQVGTGQYKCSKCGAVK